MKRRATLCVAGAMLLVGCGSGSDDATPAAAGATPTTMNMNMGDPAHPVDHMGNPTSPCSPSGASLSITANGTKFDKDCLAAPASRGFTILYDNKDSVVHNFAILESHTASDVLFRAERVQGPKVQAFNVGALRPGTYAFHCEIHPAQMSGAFIVR